MSVGRTGDFPMASLILTQPDGNEAEFPLGEMITRIGRAAENEIALDDGSISTFHAEIHPDGERHVLKDLGSTNGVRVNGERVTEARLADGDLLRFGNLRARYLGVAAPAGKTGAPAPPPTAQQPAAKVPAEAKPLGFGPKKATRSPDKIIAITAGVLVVVDAVVAFLLAFSMR